jgi:hypothetical protein
MINAAFLLVLMADVLLAALGFAQASSQKVIVTYSSRSIDCSDLFIAQDRGFFREEGLDPQLVQVRAEGNRYFHQNERGAAEVLARYLAVDLNTALETYRISRGAFTTDGIPTDSELVEYLKADAQILGLPAPVPVSKVFDFTLQREVNRELGGK